jgi:hypothetical protein
MALFLILFPAFAQEGFDDNVVDEPAVPVDNWIYPVILLTIVVVYFLMRKKQTT